MQSSKASLRKAMRGALKQLPLDTVASESREIHQRLFALPQFRDARSVSVFLSMEREVQTRPILEQCFLQGKSVFIPVIIKANGADNMDMVRLHSLADFEALPKNAWGIPEPMGEDLAQREVAFVRTPLDLIVMPGLAFDAHRNRLGYGKGYYDKYLTRIEQICVDMQWPMPATVAMALSAQLLPEGQSVPTEVYDRRPQRVLTPQRELAE
ncbi:hypothetical protein RI367_007425 [Sorochytrium milnesiophthora]